MKHPGYSEKVGKSTLEKKLHGTFVSAGLGHRIPQLGPSRPSTPKSPIAGPSRQSNPGHPSPDRRRPDSSKRSAPSGNSPPKKRGGRKWSRVVLGTYAKWDWRLPQILDKWNYTSEWWMMSVLSKSWVLLKLPSAAEKIIQFLWHHFPLKVCRNHYRAEFQHSW